MEEVKFQAPDEEVKLEYPEVALWRILIEPYQLPKTIGQIVMPEEVRNNADVLMNIGKIVMLGSLAFQSNTKQGLALSECKVASALEEGHWVLYGRYAGQQVHMRDGRKFIVLSDDEIIGRVKDPSQYQSYV